MAQDRERDIEAVRRIAERQFAALTWDEGSPADWDGFVSDFMPEAVLFPAARPAAGRSVAEFVSRMKRLSATTLSSLGEELRGVDVTVFGNVAVAAAVCAMTENGASAGESVEMMLLVKDEGRWRIAAQAWDKAGADNPVPETLLGASALD